MPLIVLREIFATLMRIRDGWVRDLKFWFSAARAAEHRTRPSRTWRVMVESKIEMQNIWRKNLEFKDIKHLCNTHKLINV